MAINMLKVVILVSIIGYATAFFYVEDFMTFEEDVPELNKTTGNFHLKNVTLPEGEARWIIKPIVNGTAKISLYFEELYLHENDNVTVYKNLEDSNNSSKSIIEPIRLQNSTITLITDEPTLVVRIDGTDKVYKRKFQVYYTSLKCTFSINLDVHYVDSPVYYGNESSAECVYNYNRDPHHRTIPAFHFEVFNYSSSSVHLSGSTMDGVYNNNPPVEFMSKKDQSVMSIDVQLNDVTKKEYFRLKMHMVDSSCSEFEEITNDLPYPIKSPAYVLDNGTLGHECLWIIKLPDISKRLSVEFTKVDFASVLDILSINDGAVASSPPLLQVTTSNIKQTMGQLVRSSGPYLWISFKPVSYISNVMLNVSVHGQGGNFKGSGEISMKKTVGNDTVFLLEVEENEVVLLSFSSSQFSSPAALSIYDGFDTKTLLATLYGNIWYPVLSRTSRMMIIATGFNDASFEANFTGISPGCLHMSTLSDANYVLSGNCNKTCMWVIPPQNRPELVLLLDLEFIALGKEDTIQILKLDSAKTLIGTVDGTMSRVPQVVIPSKTGALVEVVRKPCSKVDHVAVVGHSSFVPACGGEVQLNSSSTFHIASPLYPDTYPLLADCSWTLTAPKNSLIHLAFDKLALAPNHCLRVTNAKKNDTNEFSGSQLPEDLFLSEGSSLHFNASKCKASKEPLQLVSAEGFMLNGTVAGCGAVLEKSSGEFTVNVSSSAQNVCIWKVSLPATSDDTVDSVNIIAYTVDEKEKKGNYELEIFDGSSIRDSLITNYTATELWSRTNDLIVLYRRPNVSLSSSVFVIKYKTINCNSTMLCDNKLCMHPDWRCNGINDCGDFTDEKNCASVPIPPENKIEGYSSVSFWVTVLCMLVLGTFIGFGVPYFYQRYKNGQYRRFQDISVIE